MTVHSASDINVSEIKCRINTQDDIVWLRGTAKAIQICKLLVCSQIHLGSGAATTSQTKLFLLVALHLSITASKLSFVDETPENGFD